MNAREVDELDRLRAAFGSSSDGAVSAADCPRPDRIWAAARGEAGRAETRRLVDHTISCAACAEDWRLARELSARLEPAARVSAQWSGWPQFVRALNSGPLAAAAAAIVLFVGAAIALSILREPRADSGTAGSSRPVDSAARAVPPRAQPVLPLEPPTVKLSAAHSLATRRGENTDDRFLEELGRALEPYRAGDLAAASERLQNVATRYPRAPEPVLYQGVSLLLIGRPVEAVRPLERAREIADESLVREASWYLAVAYERSGQGARAIGELRQLCDTRGEHARAACEGAKALSTRSPQE